VVAIRDGKTSSETVRQAAEADSSQREAGETFEEVVLLDSAGRLQVPREFLEQFNIQGRVHLEALENGILIRPAQSSSSGNPLRTPIDEDTVEVEKNKSAGLRAWWKRLRGGGRSMQ
jgi:hypothetical protein